jgi:hypothetical protein
VTTAVLQTALAHIVTPVCARADPHMRSLATRAPIDHGRLCPDDGRGGADPIVPPRDDKQRERGALISRSGALIYLTVSASDNGGGEGDGHGRFVQRTGTDLANAQMDATPAAAPVVTGQDGVMRTPAEPHAYASAAEPARGGRMAGRDRAARCR